MATRATSKRTPGAPCRCGVAVTLGPDDYLQTRPCNLDGTTAWKAPHDHRSAIDSGNTILKMHHANLRHGSTCVMRTNKTGILRLYAELAQRPEEGTEADD